MERSAKAAEEAEGGAGEQDLQQDGDDVIRMEGWLAKQTVKKHMKVRKAAHVMSLAADSFLFR